jgi:hypothetical protein
MDHGLQPCGASMGVVHILIVALQCIATVLVAYLANRAKTKDRAERRMHDDRNGRS